MKIIVKFRNCKLRDYEVDDVVSVYHSTDGLVLTVETESKIKHLDLNNIKSFYIAKEGR